MNSDDLRRFRASPQVPRLAVALFATAAVMLFALASTSLPNPDNAAPQGIAASVQPENTSAAIQPSAEVRVADSPPAGAAPLGCTKLYRGQWLRVEVIHRGDVERYRLECFYGYGPKWEAM